VGMDAEGRIAGIEILEYRESHGGEVRDPRWRAQFAGKTARDPLALDRDIRNISGATLSCRHLADGVKRILALYETELRQH
jgi:Na+-transporting NADH:ubiquinone oxidoreductase subunit NqrC